jgi:hypothetical protein
MARCGGIAAGQACAHTAQRSSGNGRREGHTRGDLSIHRRQMVSWTGGAHLDVHVVQQGALVHRAYPATRVRGQCYIGA